MLGTLDLLLHGRTVVDLLRGWTMLPCRVLGRVPLTCRLATNLASLT